MSKNYFSKHVFSLDFGEKRFKTDSRAVKKGKRIKSGKSMVEVNGLQRKGGSERVADWQ